jgi:hypothetical protein
VSGNCKDCRHWGGAMSIGPWVGHGHCHGVTEGSKVERLAVVDYNHGSYNGDGLVTAPDFGCVLFEATNPNPRCPICGDTNIQTEFTTNHVPKYDVGGKLTGYDHGTPAARVMCVEGCKVSVRGQVQCAELAKAMGLPAPPFEAKEQG